MGADAGNGGLGMKITTLIENEAKAGTGLCAEHGLSMLIEIDDRRFIFDTGATGAFLENAAVLGMPLHPLEAVVISHAHFDHSGGVTRLLADCPSAKKFVLGKGYFRQKYKRTPEGSRDIGTRFTEPQLLQAGAEILWVDGMARLSPHLWAVGNFARTSGFEALNPAFVLEPDGTAPDPFADEIALAAECQKGLVVLAGCSHVGVVNLLRTVQNRLKKPIYAVVGGSHLVEANEQRIEKTVEALEKMGIEKCLLSHCTGAAAAAYLRAQKRISYGENHTGDVWEFET